MSMVVTEVDKSGTEWGVSFGGPNPELEEYVKVEDRESAFKLVGLIDKHCAHRPEAD